MFGPTRSSREGKPSAAGSLHAFSRFVALGDSFTEGLNDELRPDGRHRGWADRVASGLLARQSTDRVEYANLAIRGRLMRQVRHEQVPAAIGLRPDLVTFGAGVNDALRRTFDLDVVATDLEESVRNLRAAGANVLVFAFGDPSRRSRALGRIADRLSGLRSATLAIAEKYGCIVVDFWGVAVYDDERLWSADRLHLSALGHRVTSEAVLAALGLGDDRWREPISAPPRTPFVRRRVQDVGWFAGHAGPWLARRARGISSGAGIEPKDPQLRVLHRK